MADDERDRVEATLGRPLRSASRRFVRDCPPTPPEDRLGDPRPGLRFAAHPRARREVASSRITPEGAPSDPRGRLAVRPVEVILGGVRHPRHLAHEGAGTGGGRAAHRVHPLDVGHPAVDPAPGGGDRPERQPGDGVGARGAAIDDRRRRPCCRRGSPRWGRRSGCRPRREIRSRRTTSPRGPGRPSSCRPTGRSARPRRTHGRRPCSPPAPASPGRCPLPGPGPCPAGPPPQEWRASPGPRPGRRASRRGGAAGTRVSLWDSQAWDLPPMWAGGRGEPAGTRNRTWVRTFDGGPGSNGRGARRPGRPARRGPPSSCDAATPDTSGTCHFSRGRGFDRRDARRQPATSMRDEARACRVRGRLRAGIEGRSVHRAWSNRPPGALHAMSPTRHEIRWMRDPGPSVPRSSLEARARGGDGRPGPGEAPGHRPP